MNLHGSPTLEPDRPVYVLLHKDETHIFALPDGSADWDYNRANMELRQKILEKDFKNFNYGIATLVEALVRVSNKQAQLEELWETALKQIRRTKHLPDAWGIYKKALNALGPHPIRFDSYLRRKLKID